MFGMGFFEIFLIAIVAIIALGPEKLPTAMVEIAKFVGKFKSGVSDAKQTLDKELNLSDMKSELDSLKAQLEQTKEDAKKSSGLDDLNLDQVINGDYALDTKKEKKTKKQKASDDVVQEAQIVENKIEDSVDNIIEFEEKKAKKEDNL
ncbi:MAG: Sec-independent protein translocase protein TatB [Sulfurovum sp.]|jgi:sec-independent protein translocase protein TatB|nr:MAG: Sec-independent protein translocase protein TatB [Arcobacter lacus]